VMQNVGMYNGALGDGTVDSSHQWGLWDSGGNLAASGVIDPSNGFQQGDFFYTNDSANFNLVPNERYTLAVVYEIDDDDVYLSSVSSISTDPAVDISVAFAPSAGGLGLSGSFLRPARWRCSGSAGWPRPVAAADLPDRRQARSWAIRVASQRSSG